MKRNLTFKNIEVRSTDEQGKRFIEGIIPYNSKSVDMGFIEIIDKTAFNKTLADKAEVRALYNHDDSKLLGSTKSGTLVLTNTDEGLVCRCELPNTTYAADLYEIISRNDVNTMSFGFKPVKFEDKKIGNTLYRTLKEVKLMEVSFGVSYAAYKQTNSQTFMRGIYKMNIDMVKLNEILSKEELNKQEVDFLRSVISTLAQFAEEAEAKLEANEPLKSDESTLKSSGELTEQGDNTEPAEGDNTEPDAEGDNTEPEADDTEEERQLLLEIEMALMTL